MQTCTYEANGVTNLQPMPQPRSTIVPSSGQAVLKALRRSPLVWAVVVAAALFAFRLYVNNGPGFTNDSYQYLSNAKNLREGRGLSTSILHLDEHYYTGQIPAPQTVWAPGYSIAIAMFAWMGVSYEFAAMLVSALSLLSTILLMNGICRVLRVDSRVTWLVLLFLAGNSAFIELGGCVGSDIMLCPVILSSLYCFLLARVPGQRLAASWVYLVLGACLAALSYWARYAGAFYILAIGVFFLSQWCVRRDRTSFGQLITVVAVVTMLVTPVFARNWLYSGSLAGGNAKPSGHSFAQAMNLVATSLYHLALGDSVSKGFFLRNLVVLAGLTIAVGLGVPALAWHIVKDRQLILRRDRLGTGLLLFVIAAVYLAGILYCALRTPIDIEPRQFLIVALLSLLLLGFVFPEGYRPVFPSWLRYGGISLSLLALGSYAGCNVYSLLHNPQIATHEQVQAYLAETTADGRALGQRIEESLSSGGVVIANDGQALAYRLARPTLALCGPQYSNRKWDEKMLREAAAQYNAVLVIVFPQRPDWPALCQQSPFLAGLAKGESPAWLPLWIESGDYKVYRIGQP